MKKNQRKRNEAKENIITILLVLLAIYCIAGVAWQDRTGNLFYIFGYRPVVILSGSMEPTIKTGAIVIVKQTEDVEEQDIICFHAEDGNCVIHRYVDKSDSACLITKGDYNPKEDLEHISLEQVEGKVVLKMNFLAPIISLFL